MTTPAPAGATTTTTSGTTTTEPSPAGRPPRAPRPGVSVRTRITVAVALLVALTLAGAGALVYAIEARQLEADAYDRAEQEIDEFRQLQANGVDPDRRGRPFASVDALLETFLERNVPGTDEVLLTWYDGRLQFQLPREDTLPDDARFQDLVDGLVAENGDTRWRSPDDGEVLVVAQSARVGADGDLGALVVVIYLDEDRAELAATMRTYAIVALLSLLLVTVIAAWQSGRLLAPLRTLRETTERIGESDLSQRLPVTGNDDITALTRTVNGMLDRLEEAFVGQRQFLDDAGHELRTPLTVLRGHLELLDTGTPEEVAETKELLLDEVDRMARLVGDLILLAKSDRPDFVRPATVDLAVLTEDVLAKARGLAERDWVLDGVAHEVVALDAQRITQALLQLADNAVKHTRPGDEIGIGSDLVPEGVWLWVRDSGAGIAPEHREKVFERFGRSAVPADDEGFGLGLSIVSAIASAHGGRVGIRDAEPHGAVVEMVLPAVHPVPSPPHTREDPTWPAS